VIYVSYSVVVSETWSDRRERSSESRNAERRAGRTGAAGVAVEFDDDRSGPVADDRLPRPASESRTAGALAVVERRRLRLAGDRPHAKSVVAVAGAAARGQRHAGRQPADVAVGRVEGRRRGDVAQAARGLKPSYRQASSSSSSAASTDL